MPEVNDLISKISEPSYFHMDYKNLLGKIDLVNSETVKKIKRVAETALPFITLYQPAKLPVTVILGATHTVTCLFSLKDAWKKGGKKVISLALLQTAISTGSLACTVFLPPLGMLITTGKDLIIHSFELGVALKTKDYKKAFHLSAEIANNSLYLALFFTGASQIMIASLSLQILLGLKQSYLDFQDEKYIEGLGNLGLACIRGNQLKMEIAVFRLQLAIDAHLADVEKYAMNENTNLEKKSSSKTPKNITKKGSLSEKKLLEKAKSYFKNPEVAKKQAPDFDLSKILNGSATDQEVIDALLKNHPGFCLGENHFHEAAQAFLINNMDYLKSKKVKAVFAEGFDYKTQRIIDKYFSVKHLRELKGSDLSEVKDLLFHCEFCLSHKEGSPYTALAFMEKAKKTGVRLVGIDYHQGKNTVYSSTERMQKMNFVAAQVIEATRLTFKPDEKFVAYMGAAHLRQCKEGGVSVQGVADLTNTPAIWILDKSLSWPKKGPSLDYSEIDRGIVKYSPMNLLVRDCVA